MGFFVENNWALKLKPEQGLAENTLEENKEYHFQKDGYRVYPIDMPIDLINSQWEAVAKVIVTKTILENKTTSGTYFVLRIYQDEEKNIISNNWRETAKIITQSNETDFSKIKVT
ncbi:MAG: DUF2584 family protein [Candidatus Heimdallarchaeota archaeon]|nr:DUF2584 family protein [Candidatus Heimdallarchaeota archaeon]